MTMTTSDSHDLIFVFSESLPTCESIGIPRGRTSVGEVWTEEEFDIYQCLSDIDLCLSDLHLFLPYPAAGHVLLYLLSMLVNQPLLHLHHGNIFHQAQEFTNQLCNIPSHLWVDGWDLSWPGSSPEILLSVPVCAKFYFRTNYIRLII